MSATDTETPNAPQPPEWISPEEASVWKSGWYAGFDAAKDTAPTNGDFFHAISMDRHFDATMTHLLGDLEGVASNYAELMERMRRHWADVIGETLT